MEDTDVKELGSATQPVENPTGEATETETVEAVDFAVPEEYKNAGWASNIKSYDDLWKQHDNAQKLIGRKTIGIPNADSSEDEIQEFYSKVRPENSDKYDFDLGDDTEAFRKIFYDNGVSERQAKAITEAYKESVRKASEGLYSEEGFKETMEEALGEDYQKKIEKVNGFLKQYGRKSALAEIDKLPNETLGLVYGLINLTMDKYAVKELGTVNTKSAMSNEKDLGEYMKKMMALDSDPFVTQEKRDALRREYGIIK
jgi:hypothetical protein